MYYSTSDKLGKYCAEGKHNRLIGNLVYQYDASCQLSRSLNLRATTSQAISASVRNMHVALRDCHYNIAWPQVRSSGVYWNSGRGQAVEGPRAMRQVAPALHLPFLRCSFVLWTVKHSSRVDSHLSCGLFQGGRCSQQELCRSPGRRPATNVPPLWLQGLAQR